MSKGKNDIAWEQIFKKYNVLEILNNEGYFIITASQIGEFREARLMAKFDHKSQLPEIFKIHGLSILPITRGSYIISQFEAYKSFEEINTEITKVKFPEYIESIDYESITSESMAINCAYVSGIIADFMEDEKILPVVSGRMSSLEFEFSINHNKQDTKLQIKVSNSQIEIDGGYEGIEKLALIEAKNSISDDFLIRQLYYPYRLWSNKVSKKVKPIFMTYSNDIFSFYEYDFTEPENYNSLVLVKQKNYIIDHEDISLGDILSILDEVDIIKEPEIPFPQADNFKRVINLCELLLNDDMKKEDIVSKYDFDPRQADYYTNAGIYLGLINKKLNSQLIYSLSSKGKKIIRQKHRDRQLSLAKLILEHEVFNKSFKLYLKKGESPNKKEITNLMKESYIYNVKSDVTLIRRSSTVISWTNWILSLVNTD
ncbi:MULTISPECIES: type II restriction enzyme [Peptostreptococcaceae]|uniref:Transcriptional regulator n=1 Tax=Paeniclostridium hominis TaxID=2764329 RepID=A0ABR7K649_9FIRM|nr:transcriptional regulator [Paeniclostridium hominis]HEK8814292.1 transcriptional regulator [Clostridioides difficile]